MRKALMLSIIFATVALPALAARTTAPRKALGQLLIAAVLFNLAYVLVVMFATPTVSLEE